MPKTNDEYCEGVLARRDQSSGEITRCPYPTGSMKGWAWTKGFLAQPRQPPDPAEGRARLVREGVQGHNMREIAAGLSQL